MATKSIKTISNKQIKELQVKVKNTEQFNISHWKEGMDQIDIHRHKDEIRELWDSGDVRYWKLGNSYILTYYEQPYRAFCITKPYFDEAVLPLFK